MDQLEVEFRADEDGGISRLTWAQQFHWMWKIMRLGDNIRHLNLWVVVDVPESASQAPVSQTVVEAALRRLVERNEALRARFSDSPSGLRQQIAGSGTFPLRLWHTAPADRHTAGSHMPDSHADAERLAAALAAEPFRHETEWGIRIALVSAGGFARHVIFVMSHLIVDGGGVLALLEDFHDLLRGQADGIEPPRRWQLRDQVQREQSDQGARRNQSAIRHWRRQLERMPPSLFPAPAVAEPAAPEPAAPEPAAAEPSALAGAPRFRRLRLDSVALPIAAARIAAGCQVSPASTVLAATMIALSALTGQATCALQILVSNRFDADTRTLVGSAALHGLLVVDLPGGTVAEAVRATHRAATTTYFAGHYDPEALRSLIEVVAAQRGVRFDLTVLYNDLSSALLAESSDRDTPLPTTGSPTTGQVSGAALRELLARSAIVPESTWEGQDCTLYLAPRSGSKVYQLTLVADTACLPPVAMAALLRGIEKIMVEAACRDVQIAEVPALTGLMAPP